MLETKITDQKKKISKESLGAKALFPSQLADERKEKQKLQKRVWLDIPTNFETKSSP